MAAQRDAPGWEGGGALHLHLRRGPRAGGPGRLGLAGGGRGGGGRRVSPKGAGARGRRERGRSAGTDFQGCQASQARTSLRLRGGDRGSHHPSPPPPGQDSRLRHWTRSTSRSEDPRLPPAVPCGLEAADPRRSPGASPPKGRQSRTSAGGVGEVVGEVPRPSPARSWLGDLVRLLTPPPIPRWCQSRAARGNPGALGGAGSLGGNLSVCRQRSWRTAPS